MIHLNKNLELIVDTYKTVGKIKIDEINNYMEKFNFSDEEANIMFEKLAKNNIEIINNIDISNSENYSDDENSYDSALQIYMEEAKKCVILPLEEQKRLAKIYRTGTPEDAKDARKKLVESNLPLVIRIASGYQGRGLALEDLIAEGNIGLLYGIEKFDYTKGYAISTYVIFWIRQKIIRAIMDYGNAIRIPVHAYEKIYKIQKIYNQFEEKYRRNPTLKEIAERINKPEEKIRKYILSLNDLNIVSLEMPVGKEGDTFLIDMISDENTMSTMEAADQQVLRETLEELLKELPDREEKLIRMRFGLDGEPPMTLEQIGHRFNVSRERARQLESKALRRLKNSEYASLLSPFVR